MVGGEELRLQLPIEVVELFLGGVSQVYTTACLDLLAVQIIHESAIGRA